VPTEVFLRDEPIPRNATGKVDRRILRHQLGLA